jgi:phosphatidylglycerol:prolipoprotein diacylglycerol transferase
MIALGVILGGLVVYLYFSKSKLSKKAYIDLTITFIVTILAAFVFAILFENLYESIKHAVNGETQKWTWSQTFYGGLFGGAVAFALMYKFFYLKNNEPVLKELLIIAPGAVCLGHAIGRLGCFLNGCCFGKETEKWYGILFPGHSHKVIPTQLIEMIFLLILAGILIYFAFRHDSKWTLVVYLISYSIFRFLIEFVRGDERGQLSFLSPSQWWSIVIFTFVVAFISLKIFKYKKQSNMENTIS